jgi:glycosyltransferase involved in cell wall biosynthesis
MNITACAIVKNEENLIDPWIEHVLAISQFKEIVIIDTGSTDDTLAKLDVWENETPNVYVHHMDWNDNFAEARNYCLEKAREHSSKWCMMFDIDEFFNCNAKAFFNEIEELEDYKILHADVLQFYHVKYYTMDRMYFRTPPNRTTYVNGDVLYSNDKATMRLFKKDCVTSFGSELHEYPVYKPNTIIEESSVYESMSVPLKWLPSDFFMIHYDLAKLFIQTCRNGTTLEYEVGKKRLIYRRITAVRTNGNDYGPDWAKNVTQYCSSEEKEKAIEQLGYDQLQQSLCIDGHIFPELDIDAMELHSPQLKEWLENQKWLGASYK